MVDKSAIRILVLDDEPFMLKLLSHVLANLGFIQVDDLRQRVRGVGVD